MNRTYVFTRYGGPEQQEMITGPEPVPGAGELVVAVHAAAVNPVDWKIRAGRLGETGRALPAPMGRELAGVVVAVGPDVPADRVGEAIIARPAPGHGAFADRTVVRAAEAVAKPDGVAFVDAATVPVAGTTAYALTHEVDLEPGRTMVVLGAGGGVGLMAVQIGVARGLRVIGVASEGKRELVESSGATFVLSGNGAADRVRALAPAGADLLADLVGGQVLRDLAPVLAEGGTVVSAASPDVAGELGGTGPTLTPEGMAAVTELIARGVVDPRVTARYPLDRVAEAIAAVETGHAAGKVVIVVVPD